MEKKESEELAPIERVSAVQHDAWWHWSDTLAKELLNLREIIDRINDHPGLRVEALNMIDKRLEKWKPNWIPYKDLPDEIQDYDREWAEKVLEVVPALCPVWQCGGTLKHVERDPPEGGNPDEYGDGYDGDFQTPDLYCPNCNAFYEFKGFKKLKEAENGSSNRKVS